MPKKPPKKKRQNATEKPCTALMVIGRPTKRRQIAFSRLRKRFIQEYERNYGNISATCTAIGIHRATVYRWLKSNSRINIRFRAALEAAQPTERLLDAAEHVVAAHLADGNLKAAEFVLKSAKAKSRQYHEKVEIEQVDPMTEELKKLQGIIQARAQQEGVSYGEMLQIFKENHAQYYPKEIVEKLVSDAVN